MRELYYKDPYQTIRIQWICSWLKWIFWAPPLVSVMSISCLRNLWYYFSDSHWECWILASPDPTPFNNTPTTATPTTHHFLFTNFEGVWISQSNNISQASGESKFFFAKRRGECNVSHTFISYAWWTETVMKTAWPTVPHQYYWAFMKTW